MENLKGILYGIAAIIVALAIYWSASYVALAIASIALSIAWLFNVLTYILAIAAVVFGFLGVIKIIIELKALVSKKRDEEKSRRLDIRMKELLLIKFEYELFKEHAINGYDSREEMVIIEETIKKFK